MLQGEISKWDSPMVTRSRYSDCLSSCEAVLLVSRIMTHMSRFISLRDVHNAGDVPGMDFQYLESMYNFGHMSNPTARNSTDGVTTNGQFTDQSDHDRRRRPGRQRRAFTHRWCRWSHRPERSLSDRADGELQSRADPGASAACERRWCPWPLSGHQ